VYGDHRRYVNTYFSSFPGYSFTGSLQIVEPNLFSIELLLFLGDGANRDEDGYYWITGRVDDLMNVSGHLLSTAEIESALVAHVDVVEAAVVAAPHDIKGQFPYAFVTLANVSKLTNLRNRLSIQTLPKTGN